MALADLMKKYMDDSDNKKMKSSDKSMKKDKKKKPGINMAPSKNFMMKKAK